MRIPAHLPMQSMLPLFGAKKQQDKKRTKILAMLDMDGCVLGEKTPEGKKLQKLASQQIRQLKKEYAQKGLDLKIAYMSARPPLRILQEELAEPDYTAPYNGGTILKGFPTPGKRPLEAWERLKRKYHFKPQVVWQAIEELKKDNRFKDLVIESVGKVVNSPDADGPDVATVCIRLDSLQLKSGESPNILESATYQVPQQINEFFHEVKQKVKATGAHFTATPPYLFHGKPYILFDISNPLANKASASEFMMNRLGIITSHFIGAGDQQNDSHVLKDDGRRGIAVGKDNFFRTAVSRLLNNRIIVRPTTEPTPIGVLNGLKLHLDEIVKNLNGQNSQPKFQGVNRTA